MALSIVVLVLKSRTSKMRSSRFIITNIAQKVIAKFGIHHKLEGTINFFCGGVLHAWMSSKFRFPVQTSAWTKYHQRSLAEIKTLTRVLSTSSTCHVTNQCSHLNKQDGKVLGLAWVGGGRFQTSPAGGTLLLVRLGFVWFPTCLKLNLMNGMAHTMA